MPKPQGNLFGETEPSPPEDKGLVLTKRPDRTLTKAQKTFNRLVAKIESLRNKLELETRQLDRALAYYAEHLHPRIQRHVSLRKELVLILAGYLDHGKLKSRGDRKALSELIKNELVGIVQNSGPLDDADLQFVFERVHGVTWDEIQRTEVNAAISSMKEMTQDFGLNVDFSSLRPDMTPDEFAAKMAELQSEVEAKYLAEEDAQPERRPNKQQLKKEERQRQAEEARKRGIGTIYKQLARTLHPDLEMDPERRERKSALMQELTAAYRNNDLHTLLRLELEWIEREEGDLDRMTDEKLAIYNAVLKEQVEELEWRIEDLAHLPQYAPILVSSTPFESSVRTADPAQAREIDLKIAGLEAGIDRLKSERARDEVQTIIQDWRDAEREQARIDRMMNKAMRRMRGTPF